MDVLYIEIHTQTTVVFSVVDLHLMHALLPGSFTASLFSQKIPCIFWKAILQVGVNLGNGVWEDLRGYKRKWPKTQWRHPWIENHRRLIWRGGSWKSYVAQASLHLCKTWIQSTNLEICSNKRAKSTKTCPLIAANGLSHKRLVLEHWLNTGLTSESVGGLFLDPLWIPKTAINPRFCAP